MSVLDNCIKCKEDGTHIICKNYCPVDSSVPFTYASCPCGEDDCTLEAMKHKAKYPNAEDC